ncbi:MAG: hypothetical protein NC099_06090 [Corallococcus sp.]|nr:hypothetical protein [Bacillota bacterium]MCM1534203.1 hypothetical protein [Corallococcus sp.]
MKKIALFLTVMVLATSCALFCACTSDAPIVGTYKLYNVVMTNGTTQNVYLVGGVDSVVTENSFVLTVKNNYKWNMSINLPGVDETEDGRWAEKNGGYVLKEDRDDPDVELTLNNDVLTFSFNEDGWYMLVTLIKAD